MRSQPGESFPLTMGEAAASERRPAAILIAALLALLSALMLIFATPHGIGASPDSAAFIGTARQIAAGQNLFSLADTHQPPFYPLALALAALPGSDPLAGARWLHTLLFAANVLLFALILQRLLSRLWLIAAGALLFLFAAPIFTIHSYAWSEPLFILLALSGLLLLDTYVQSGRRRHLLASAVVIALACLTRYAGLPLIASGALAILFFARTPRRRRLLDAFLFSIVAALPLLLWLARNLFVAGAATSRQFSFHPAGRAHLWQMFYTLSGWLQIPDTFPDIVRFLVWAALFLAAGAIIVLTYTGKRAGAPQEGAYPTLLNILALFALIYISFLFTSISFFDANTPLDDRLLAPLFAAVLPIALFLLQQGLHLAGGRRWPSWLAVAPLLLLLTLTAWQSAGALRLSRQTGIGYNSPTWQQSPLLAEIDNLPQNIVIYSNAPEAINLLQDRQASALPRINDAMTQTVNQTYHQELNNLLAQVENGSAMVAYFHSLAHRPVTGESELREQYGLQPFVQTSDGVILGPAHQTRQ